MNAAQLTIDAKPIPHVTGRTLLTALGYGIGLGATLGVLTGFGLPAVVPALSSAWLQTIIVTEVYLSLIIGHMIAFGGLRQMSQTLQLESSSWRNIGLAFVLWVAFWGILVIPYIMLGSSVQIIGEMGRAVLKIGSLYGMLNGASPAFFALAFIQTVLLAPLAEEILFRGSLYGWLRGKLNATATILIAAALFALYHPLITLWPMAFLFGLIAGAIRERTQSLTPFLIMHMLDSIALITIAYFVTGWRV